MQRKASDWLWDFALKRSSATVQLKQVKISPPPSFESATFRGRKMPDKITLGDGKFKPRLGLYSRRNLGGTTDSHMSSYME